jgi:hypothetical protein
MSDFTDHVRECARRTIRDGALKMPEKIEKMRADHWTVEQFKSRATETFSGLYMKTGERYLLLLVNAIKMGLVDDEIAKILGINDTER